MKVVVKKRAIRVIPYCHPKFWGKVIPFTLESVGPEGYDV
jgi:hypothetical protein